MKQNIYSIRDNSAEVYGELWFEHTHGSAERQLRQLSNDPKSKVCAFPEDYSLYFIGEFDNKTGKFSGPAEPTHIVKAVQLKSTPVPTLAKDPADRQMDAVRQ